MYKIKDSLWENKEREERADRRINLALVLLVFFIFTVLFLNTAVYTTVRVDGPSMCYTLEDEDVLTVNKIKRAKYGDIVVIETKGKWIIKRIIGKGGDSILIKDGYVYRNGEKLIEKYTSSPTYPTDKNTAWVVPEGHVFFLGDNRSVSLDSRSDYFGTVSENCIIGVVENWSVALKDIRSEIYYGLDAIAKFFGMTSCTNVSAEVIQ